MMSYFERSEFDRILESQYLDVDILVGIIAIAITLTIICVIWSKADFYGVVNAFLATMMAGGAVVLIATVAMKFAVAPYFMDNGKVIYSRESSTATLSEVDGEYFTVDEHGNATVYVFTGVDNVPVSIGGNYTVETETGVDVPTVAKYYDTHNIGSFQFIGARYVIKM